MSLGNTNGAVGYQVIYSAAILQELKRLRATLSDTEAIRGFAAALRTIHARLRRDPTVFGEPRHRLPNSPVVIRAAAVAPVFVSYGVHEERRIVFVREFKLLGGREP